MSLQSDDEISMDEDIQLLVKSLKSINGTDARLEYLKGQDSDILARFVVVLFKQIGILTLLASLDDLKSDLSNS